MNDTSTGAGQTPLFFGTRWRRSSTVIGWTLGLLGISYLLWQAFRQASAITTSGYRPVWLLLPVIVLIMVGQSIVATTVYGCLRLMNGQARLAPVLRVYFVSQAAKYLPGGGLLNLTAQTIGLSQKGQSSPSQGVIVTILTMAALCAGGLSWYGFTLVISEHTGDVLPLLFGGALPLLIVFLASMRIWRRLVTPTLRGKLRAFLDELADWAASPRVFALLACVGIVPWCVFGAALSLLVSSELSLSWSLVLRLPGVLAASWVLGFITVIVPAGLGVRDVTLMALLKPILPEPMPVVIPLLLRLAWISADLLNMLLVIAITGRFGHKGSSRGREAVNR